jgi:transposase
LPLEIDVIHIDECGVNRHLSREYGRAPRGERVYLPTTGRKFKKLNIVAGLRDGEVICPTKYDWNTNAEWFLEWFEWWFCPLLRNGSVIIMDNASFHKKTVLNAVAATYGYQIIWLPPYSPDKNPIEHLWANLKKLASSSRKRIFDNSGRYFSLFSKGIAIHDDGAVAYADNLLRLARQQIGTENKCSVPSF